METTIEATIHSFQSNLGLIGPLDVQGSQSLCLRSTQKPPVSAQEDDASAELLRDTQG